MQQGRALKPHAISAPPGVAREHFRSAARAGPGKEVPHTTVPPCTPAGWRGDDCGTRDPRPCTHRYRNREDKDQGAPIVSVPAGLGHNCIAVRGHSHALGAGPGAAMGHQATYRTVMIEPEAVAGLVLGFRRSCSICWCNALCVAGRVHHRAMWVRTAATSIGRSRAGPPPDAQVGRC